MRSTWSLLTLVALLICLLVCGLSIRAAAMKKSELKSAMAQRQTLVKQLQQYQLLSAQQPDTIYGSEPQTDFEQRVTTSIQAAGISSRTRFSARSEADREHRDGRQQLTGLRQQRASVDIPAISPAEIGKFLVHWQEAQSMWSPDRIQLTHDQRAAGNLYTLRLECVAVYHPQESE